MMHEIKGLPDPHDIGIIAKYHVRKINDPDLKHLDCFFFVLDPEHDPFARAALAAYAQACNSTYPRLAMDLRAKLSRFSG
jgi:hypothetical protein